MKKKIAILVLAPGPCRPFGHERSFARLGGGWRRWGRVGFPWQATADSRQPTTVRQPEGGIRVGDAGRPGGPDSVRAEATGFEGNATGKRRAPGRDGARPSRVFGQAGVRGDGLGGPDSVRAEFMGFEGNATGKRRAHGRDGARPSRNGFENKDGSGGGTDTKEARRPGSI